MLFEKVFVEKQVKENLYTLKILEALKNPETILIDKIENIFEKVKKPYLQKRTNLNLFIGRKEGQLIKEAPNAYGFSSEFPHYYFIHSYNCIYECQYCYLQGYFNSPDIVLFVNHEEIQEEMKRLCEVHANTKVWFHAGEFSDSFALANITQEVPSYFELFKNLPNAFLEFRTKSVNIKQIENLEPLENVVISFSLSPQEQTKKYDLQTPTFDSRIKAVSNLAKKGFKIGLHFDPIIFEENFDKQYEEMISKIAENVPESQIVYISLGVVRFTKDVYFEVQKNYPESEIHASEFIKSFDNKTRYNKPQRLWMLNKIKQLCIRHNLSEEKIYFCMEE
ncbi:MAG: hypothetical protein DWQ06_09190 [Calditrichaeota bacterium]|nr:MAG: hypothetical protein DWQ06_09190 [Calditrichota bacterium]